MQCGAHVVGCGVLASSVITCGGQWQCVGDADRAVGAAGHVREGGSA